jgi:hypothetical protein
MPAAKLTKFQIRSLRQGIGGPAREVADNTGDEGDLVVAIRNLNTALDDLTAVVTAMAADIASIKASTDNLKPNGAATGIVATLT